MTLGFEVEMRPWGSEHAIIVDARDNLALVKYAGPSIKHDYARTGNYEFGES